MIRLLFLDFDGVLHPTSAQPEEFFSRAWLLEDALAGAACGIVISSSWRHHHSFPDVVDRLPRTLQPLVIGSTGEPHVGAWPRYNEILRFLGADVSNVDWRALDDSWLEFPSGCAHLIACDPNVGVDTLQLTELRHWLAGP